MAVEAEGALRLASPAVGAGLEGKLETNNSSPEQRKTRIPKAIL